MVVRADTDRNNARKRVYSMKKTLIALLALVLLLALARGAAAQAEDYWGAYTGGLHVIYDPGMFELADTFEENGEVRFLYRGETPVPVCMDIRCYPDRDQADVDFEVAGPYGRESHDAVIGNNYYDAMSYYCPEDVQGVERRRYLYILSCLRDVTWSGMVDGIYEVVGTNDVFVIEIDSYAGIPEEVNDALNAMLDSFEFGGD